MTTTTDIALSGLEVTGLIDLVAQLRDVLEAPSGDDPALARLAPDAYPDDADAAREFRRLTEGDITARRLNDAGVFAETLRAVVPEADATAEVVVSLDAAQVGAWMRTLAAMRLIIATRLGITADTPHDEEDPAYGIYDWLAYRLEMLIEASDVD